MSSVMGSQIKRGWDLEFPLGWRNLIDWQGLPQDLIEVLDVLDSVDPITVTAIGCDTATPVYAGVETPEEEILDWVRYAHSHLHLLTKIEIARFEKVFGERIRMS